MSSIDKKLNLKKSILQDLPDVKMGAVIGAYPTPEDFLITKEVLIDVYKDRLIDIKPIINNLTNKVFVFQLENNKIYVIKMGHFKNSYSQFKIAEFASSIARLKDIPVPIIENIIKYKDYSFQISQYMPGIPANIYKGNTEAIWYQIGDFAKKINDISVPIFNREYNLEKDQIIYYQNWNEYVQLEVEDCIDNYFISHLNVIDIEDLDRLKRLIEDYKKLNFSPKLIHGDLWLKNIKINENGKVVAILDWENASANFAPYAEFARSFEYRTQAEQDAFEKGYGLKLAEHKKMVKYNKQILTIEWFFKHLAFLIKTENWGSALHHEILLKELLNDFDTGLRHIWDLTNEHTKKDLIKPNISYSTNFLSRTNGLIKDSKNIDYEEYELYHLQKDRFLLADNKYCIVNIIKPNKCNFDLWFDSRFLNTPIKLDNRFLINQQATSLSWGSIPGMLPNNIIKTYNSGLCLMPSNWGWQTNQILIVDDKLITIKNDEHIEAANYEGIYFNGNKWNNLKLKVTSKKFINYAEDNIKIGFSYLPLIREGEILEFSEIASNPRVLADLRNFFNFTFNKQIPPYFDKAFWTMLRNYLPTNTSDAISLWKKESVISTSYGKSPDNNEYILFNNIIKEAGLENHLSLTKKNNEVVLVISDGIPLNRTPWVVTGLDKDNNLILLLIDGRQKETVGANLIELIEIMKLYNIHNGGIGAAGGDVFLIDNNENILNKPSNIIYDAGKTNSKHFVRPATNLLILH